MAIENNNNHDHQHQIEIQNAAEDTPLKPQSKNKKNLRKILDNGENRMVIATLISVIIGVVLGISFRSYLNYSEEEIRKREYALRRFWGLTYFCLSFGCRPF